jgi:probable rRNA maturation factor
MQSGEKDITIEFADDFKDIDFDRGRLKRLIRHLCRRFGLSKAMVSIAILGDEGIRKINRKFLKKDAATDVISFDLSDEGQAEKVFELVVNGEQARREGLARGHGPEGELALYVVHGLLHNLGFDDSDEAGAEKMHLQEDEILQQFGYGVIYKGRTSPGAEKK